MGLGLYKKKRDFTKTPEPGPSPRHVPKTREGLRFCVQKHDATRLHYDFRLELDGVLKSWAVTKGPSINPADKRLAVRTEDHPFSYRDFEGTIPEKQYGGGTVMLWDEGTWTPLSDPHAGLKKGRLSFELSGQRLKGRWALVRMRKPDEKRESWLLIKEKDEESATGTKAEDFLDRHLVSIKTGATMEDIAGGRKKAVKKKAAPANAGGPAVQPLKTAQSLKSLIGAYRQVQLATLVTEPPHGDEWVHEVKLDGYRILCFVSSGAVAIITRNGNDWTHRFPAVVKALKKLEVRDAVLDGEAVLLDAQGISGFQALQQALGDDGRPEDIQACLFDILHLDGKDLRGDGLLERKKTLKQLLGDVERPLYYGDHAEDTKTILQQACRMKLEGLVSKRKSARYFEGRSKSWLKSKCNRRQEFVIVGFTKAKSGPRAIGALHIGYMSEERLVYAGKVGTGFGMQAAQDLFDALMPLKAEKAGVEKIPTLARKGTTWVRPQMLCEVSFTEWTKDGRVRHPSFEGLREDKSPGQAVRETPQAPDAGLHGINITHGERVLFEKDQITKLDIASYYAAIAPHMLAQIEGRPVSLLRCPGGVPASCFFQRNPDEHMAKEIKSFNFTHKGKTHEYMYVENTRDLMFLAQMGVIEIHPWGAAAKRIDYPLQMIFDLDPDEDVPFEAVKLAARDLRARLKAVNLESFVKCTGGKGLHVTVPLSGRQKWPEVRAFAEAFARRMSRDVPEAYVSTMSKDKRAGKIFIDYFRNDYAATAIADYAVRARPGAPVAVPLEWDELDDLVSANAFSMQDVLHRVGKSKPVPTRYGLKQKIFA
jgi:bifunctional non-homologous end joining protein LigD